MRKEIVFSEIQRKLGSVIIFSHELFVVRLSGPGLAEC